MPVLVADDNDTNRLILTEMTAHWGMRPLGVASGAAANDGREALSILEQQPVDSAYAMKGDRERCRAAGMDGYLAKPIQAKELYEVIEEIAAVVRT